MNNAQQLWLCWETDIPCSVRRWTEESARQFAVLPFYEDDIVQPGRERYMLWGSLRALSDDGFYPIPHDWYSMHLVQARYSIGCYQWVCRCNPGGRTRMELQVNKQEALIDPVNGAVSLALAADVLTMALSCQSRCRLH